MSYTINITRYEKEGILTFKTAKASVSTTCYWDLKKKIPTGIYSGCSATTMARKKNSKKKPREGIYIPNVKGFAGIFIHMGTSSAWSDGCIVIKEAQVLKIYDAITPKDGRNVTVKITDFKVNIDLSKINFSLPNMCFSPLTNSIDNLLRLK